MMAKTHNSVLLDVDRSIIEHNLLLKETCRDEFVDLFPTVQPPDNFPWKLVHPSPGMCVKTRDADGGKVFLNICHTPDLPAPEDVDEEKLLQILYSETPSSFRVPMSIGAGREEPDKGGKPCMVYDVAINSSFLQKTEKSKIFLTFLLSVVTEGVQDKFSFELETGDHVILKNRKVMGKLSPHRIQQRSLKPEKPLIEEVGSPGPSTSLADQAPHLKELADQAPPGPTPHLKELPAPHSSYKQPEYRIFVKPESEGECLIGQFKFPDVLSSKELTLDVGEDRIVLESRRKGYLLDVFIPYAVDQNRTCAQFNTDTQLLTLTMPVVASN